MINNPTMINPYPVVDQATPSISVSSSGLITSTASQSAGLVNAGSKSATKQLTTKAATTITPGTSSKTAIASQTFATGNITVAGDSNLIASNIKSGVSIFGVNGSASSWVKYEQTPYSNQYIRITVDKEPTYGFVYDPTNPYYNDEVSVPAALMWSTIINTQFNAYISASGNTMFSLFRSTPDYLSSSKRLEIERSPGSNFITTRKYTIILCFT